MMFSLTPIVVQLRSPLVESTSTRVTAPVPLCGVEHPHLVVGEVHRGRAPGSGRRARSRSAVSSAFTGPLPSAVAIDALAADVHLDRGLGGDARAGRPRRVVVVGDDPERLHLEPVAAPSRWPAASAARATRRPPRSGSRRAPCASACRRRSLSCGPSSVRPSSLALSMQRALARELRHHEAGAVADGVGRDVLVGVGPLGDRARRAARPCARTPTSPTYAACGLSAMFTSSATWCATGVSRSSRSRRDASRSPSSA